MIVKNGGSVSRVDEAVLFPFDTFSVPLRYRLQVGLISATSPWRPHEIVLSKGQLGTPDSKSIWFTGSIIRVGDQFRMWYIGVDDNQGRRVCYAISRDGVHWEKPKLGLVEYNGNTQNNLVDFERQDASACLVMYDPEDLDPDRRFKVVYEVSPFHIGAAFSPDGI